LKRRFALLFLAAYPRWFRGRYGDEMRALLEEHPVSAATLVDLLRGATAAHLEAGRRRAARTVPTSSERNSRMRVLLAISLLIGFLAVDAMFFHDVFKAGETTTIPQYMTGILSIPVIAMSLGWLARRARRNTNWPPSRG
jgi:hypothetical protein